VISETIFHVISPLAQNTQPSQPITWLILIKSSSTIKQPYTKLITYVATEANATKPWFKHLYDGIQSRQGSQVPHTAQDTIHMCTSQK